MPGQQFREDTDLPVFDMFDKPVLCLTETTIGEEGEPTPCCDECASWLNCLGRVPFKLDLNGFDFREWMKWVRFNGMSAKPDDGSNPAAFTGSSEGTNEWDGVYIAAPRAESRRVPFCASHLVRGDRTVSTPATAIDKPIKRFYLELGATCGANSEGVHCIRFTVYVRFEYESASQAVGGSTAPFCGPLEGETYSQQCLDAGGPWCPGQAPPGSEGIGNCETACPDPATLGSMDPAEEVASGCCPLLKSDCIPVANLQWDDLTNVPLRAATGCELINHPLSNTTVPSEGCCWPTGGLYVFGHAVAATNSCSFGALSCYNVGNAPGVWDVDCLECPGVFFPPGQCQHAYWIPPPIKVNGDDGSPEGFAVNFLSVLAKSCDYVVDCGYCELPDPPPANRLRTPATVDFHWTPVADCCKTFIADYPDCLVNPQFFWSFGKEGAQVNYCLRNTTDESPIEYAEYIELTVIDERGCIYHVKKLVTCNCACEGVDGNLLVEQISVVNCQWLLTASITGPECADQAFIEYCIPGINATGPHNPCLDDADEIPANFFCAELGDGVSTVVNIPPGCKTIRWRVWDTICSCPGPWNYVDLCCNKCECCNGAIGGATVSITGIGTKAPCANAGCSCAGLNISYDAPVDSCGSVFDNSHVISIGPPAFCGTAVTIRATWQLHCDPTGHWLRLCIIADEMNCQVSHACLDIFLGLVKPTCDTISECITINTPTGFNCCCDYDAVTVCAELYA